MERDTTIDPDDANVSLSAEEIAEESAWLRSLGLKTPDEPLLLHAPFAPPLTSRSFITPSSRHWREAPRSVSAQHLRLDLDILEVAMEKAYAGWEPAVLAGWDWRNFFERWRARLATKDTQELSIAEAFQPWADLMRFQLDNHSGPVTEHRFSGFSRTVLVEDLPGPIDGWRNRAGQRGPRDASDPAHQPRRCRILQDGEIRWANVVTYPSNLGEWEAVSVGGAWHPVKAVRLGIRWTPRPGDAVSFRWLAPDAGYVRIPSLSYALASSLTEKTDWLPAGAHQAASLVFDLRGNEGGAATVVFFLLKQLLGWQGIESALSFSIRRKDSCITHALAWGFAQAKLKGCVPPLPAQLQRVVQQALDAVVAPHWANCPVKFYTTKAKWGFQEHVFPAPPPDGKPSLVVLTDNGCGSDGEFLVYLLATIPGTAIVGVNTAGVGGFARPGYFVLPRTSVPFRLATALADLYGDERSFEGYGFNPDIVIDSEQDLTDAQLADLAVKIRQMS